MAKVYSIFLQPENSKSGRKYKNFDATINAEQRIASALYDGYAKLKGKGTVRIAKYYVRDYCYWKVVNGQYQCDVSDYESEDGVKDLNHKLIGQMFEAYKAGTHKPLKITEVYDFLKEKRADGLKTLELQHTFRYDFHTFGPFIANVLAYPQKYSKKVYEVCRIVYSNTHSLYGTSIPEDMTLYPDWLRPKGFESERVGNCTWKMSAELDGQIVSAQITYDAKGINKFGAVGEIELAGKLTEWYILYLIEGAYKDYTENNIDYKIIQVVSVINRYVEYVRGEDFRSSYNKPDHRMKSPDEFIIDMTELLSEFPDNRFKKDDVYLVINYFKNHKDKFKAYYEKSNKCMEQFYPWFEGRMAKGQKLFKNVPKD